MLIIRTRIPLKDIVEKVVQSCKAKDKNHDFRLDAITFDKVDWNLTVDLEQTEIKEKDKVS